MCDSVFFDGSWLNLLFTSAQIPPEFTLTDIRYWYQVIGSKNSILFQDYLNDKQPTHRALGDVLRYVRAAKKYTDVCSG